MLYPFGVSNKVRQEMGGSLGEGSGKKVEDWKWVVRWGRGQVKLETNPPPLRSTGWRIQVRQAKVEDSGKTSKPLPVLECI